MIHRRVSSTILAASILGSAGAAQVPAPPDSEPVSFRNGDVTLAGTVYLPSSPGPHPALVAFHWANGPTRSDPTYQHLATRLPRAGIAVLLYDRRGSGESSGRFETASFKDLAADGISGIRYLGSRKDVDRRRIGVWGISQGGWLAPLAATMRRDIAFVVAVSSSGVSPAEQMDYAAEYTLEHSGRSQEAVKRALATRAKVNDYYRGRLGRGDAEAAVRAIRGEPWFEEVYLPRNGDLPDDPRSTKWYLEMDYDPLPVLEQLRVPIAFFFGTADRWVPVEQSIANIRKATRSNPEVMIRKVPGTDHLMGTGEPDSGGPVSGEYVKALLDWLKTVSGER